jgi:hypothetical protein
MKGSLLPLLFFVAATFALGVTAEAAECQDCKVLITALATNKDTSLEALQKNITSLCSPTAGTHHCLVVRIRLSDVSTWLGANRVPEEICSSLSLCEAHQMQKRMDTWTASAMREAYQQAKKHKGQDEYMDALVREEALRTDFNKESFRLVYENQLRKKAGKELAKERERLKRVARKSSSSWSDEVEKERALAEAHRTRAARAEIKAEKKLSESLPRSNHAAVRNGLAFPAENFKAAKSLPIPASARPSPNTMRAIAHQNAAHVPTTAAAQNTVHVQTVAPHKNAVHRPTEDNIKKMLLHAKQ